MPKAGTSNNPAGRPIGTGVVARLRRELLNDGKIDTLVQKVYDMAAAGDMAAARLLLDRVLPPLRTQAERITFSLPEGSLTDQARALLRAAADGELTTDQAAELISAIGRTVAVEQGDELRRRLEALEFDHLA